MTGGQSNGSSGGAEHSPVKRLHSCTLWVPLLSDLPQLAVAAVVASFVTPLGTLGFFGFWYVLVPLTALHVLRFVTFRYQVRGGELFLRSGLLWRNERRIPLERIQDTRLHQGIFHRLFKVVKLEITTAASEQREAVLNVVSIEEATDLREAVFSYQEGAPAGIEADDPTTSQGGEVLRLGIWELVLGGLTSRIASTLFALVGAVVYFTIVVRAIGGVTWKLGEHLAEWEDELVPEADGWWSFVLEPLSWDDTLVGSVLLVLGGLVFSVVRFVARYHRYRLTRAGNILSRSHGLLAVKSSSLARDRIQALKLEEGLLRRWFKLAALWADSGGDRSQVDDANERDPFVPVARRADALRLVKQALPSLPDAEPEWTRVSRLAVRRGSRVGWAVLLVAMVSSILPLGWLVLALLPGFPLIYFVNVQWYRNAGYWIDDNTLVSRRGWLSRRTLYLPLRNLQSVTVSQSYFDRRLHLATLKVDTAGRSNTGGGAAIRNIPAETARSIQSTLASRVASLVPHERERFSPDYS